MRSGERHRARARLVTDRFMGLPPGKMKSFVFVTASLLISYAATDTYAVLVIPIA
jgi:hypothetical protein